MTRERVELRTTAAYEILLCVRDAPDVDDGLRDVERRVLRAVSELAPTRFVKTTRILTRALGDDPQLSAYACVVDLAQRYRANLPLLEFHGNFGSQHGDPPADAVYTECRLSAWGRAVLDGRAPNLLVNGARSERPRAFHVLPHHPGEVVAALVDALEGAAPRVLLPDFPCGGVVDQASLAATGIGTVRLRARLHVEHVDGVPLVVMTEAPQDVELNELVLAASRARRDGLVPGLADLRDESTRDGLRIVFVGTRGASPEDIEAALYAHTPCAIALDVDGRVRVDGTERCLPIAELVQETARRMLAHADGQRAATIDALRSLGAHATPRRTSSARFDAR